MNLVLGIIVVMYFLGIIMMIVEFRIAPEGYEDEAGLHTIWINNSPGLRDVSLVWD